MNFFRTEPNQGARRTFSGLIKSGGVAMTGPREPGQISSGQKGWACRSGRSLPSASRPKWSQNKNTWHLLASFRPIFMGHQRVPDIDAAFCPLRQVFLSPFLPSPHRHPRGWFGPAIKCNKRRSFGCDAYAGTANGFWIGSLPL